MVPKRLVICAPPTLLALLLLVMALSTSAKIPLGNTVGVTILSDTGSPVDLHCKSHEDDLGEHTIPYGKMFHWEFQPSAALTTLYWCHFRWYDPDSQKTLYALLDVWDIDIQHSYQDDIADWKVEKDGFYMWEIIDQKWDKNFLDVWSEVDPVLPPSAT